MQNRLLRLLPGAVLALAFTALAIGGCRATRPQAAGEEEAGQERPNVVILFADDLGYGDLGSYGHPLIRTPRLDQMGREGVRLTSFYTASSLCTPSRAALLTGRYPVRSGMARVLYPNADHGLPRSEVTLAEALSAQGYRTKAVGKWHLGDRPPHLPINHGFDSYLGVPYSNDMIRREPIREDPPLPLVRDTAIVEAPVDQHTLTTRYTEEAVEFVRSTEEPFFLYLAYTMPHVPLHVAERLRGQSAAGLYGDVIEALDWSAGQVIEALDAAGVADETIVIFTSDNGPKTSFNWKYLEWDWEEGSVERWHGGSPGPLRGGKGTPWEGGHRVPAIVRWPGEIPAGTRSSEMVTAMDLYTTLIEAAGGEVPSDRVVDGLDVMPLLKGQTDVSPHEAFYYYLGDRAHAVREGTWKLQTYPDSVQLFDLANDPAERFDVSPAHPERTRRLRKQLRRFNTNTGLDAQAQSSRSRADENDESARRVRPPASDRPPRPGAGRRRQGAARANIPVGGGQDLMGKGALLLEKADPERPSWKTDDFAPEGRWTSTWHERGAEAALSGLRAKTLAYGRRTDHQGQVWDDPTPQGNDFGTGDADVALEGRTLYLTWERPAGVAHNELEVVLDGAGQVVEAKVETDGDGRADASTGWHTLSPGEVHLRAGEELERLRGNRFRVTLRLRTQNARVSPLVKRFSLHFDEARE